MRPERGGGRSSSAARVSWARGWPARVCGSIALLACGLLALASVDHRSAWHSVAASRLGRWVGSWVPPGRACAGVYNDIYDAFVWNDSRYAVMPTLDALDPPYYPNHTISFLYRVPPAFGVVLLLWVLFIVGYVMVRGMLRSGLGPDGPRGRWWRVAPRLVWMGLRRSWLLGLLSVLAASLVWRFWIGAVGVELKYDDDLWDPQLTRVGGLGARLFLFEFNPNGTPAKFVVDCSTHGTGVDIGIPGLVSVALGGWLLFTAAVCGGVKSAYAMLSVADEPRCGRCGYPLEAAGAGEGDGAVRSTPGRCPECGSLLRLEAGARPRVWVLPWGPYRRGWLALGLVVAALWSGPMVIAWARLLWPGPLHYYQHRFLGEAVLLDGRGDAAPREP